MWEPWSVCGVCVRPETAVGEDCVWGVLWCGCVFHSTVSSRRTCTKSVRIRSGEGIHGGVCEEMGQGVQDQGVQVDTHMSGARRAKRV